MTRELHEILIDLVNNLNGRRLDEWLLGEAGVALDRALFPLLVRIDHGGPIGIVDLADQVGRDHSTISRQVAKLERLGLVRQQVNPRDQRGKDAELTAAGQEIVARIAAARRRGFDLLMEGWSEEDRAELIRLLGRFVDTMTAHAREAG